MSVAFIAPRTNGLVDPLGLDDPNPRFSWRAPAATAAARFDLVVASRADFDPAAVTWSATDLTAPEFGVAYQGAPLKSRTRYWWRARAVTAGQSGPWSEAVWFETGILQPEQWDAEWITSPSSPKNDVQTLYFRGDVELERGIVRARVYASALGWYRLFVNSQDLTGHALVPRWTSFDKLVEYQVYDATEVVRAGENAIGIVVAEGRYRGRVGGAYKTRVYGDRLGAIAQLVVDYSDGTTAVFGTDQTWSVGTGRIRTSDPMSGERVDLRVDDQGWLLPGGHLPDAQSAAAHPVPPGDLVAEEVPRVIAFQELAATVSVAPSGAQLIDFGQCFAGVARVRLRGPSGTTVRLSYSEVLRPDGELDTTYLGANPKRKVSDWFQRDEAILGEDPVDYTPWFTIHGFRYLSVEGLDAPVDPADVAGIVLTTDAPAISDFHSSDPRLEQLWRNVRWSLRSNFTDTPTDCPSRERSGWTGDIQVFAPTALQLVDSEPFLRRYLRNLAIDQNADGTVPPFIPSETVAGRGRGAFDFARTSAGWGDASVLIPWAIYAYRGDRSVLERQYDSAVAWVDSVATRAATKKSFIRRVGRRVEPAREKLIVDRGYSWGEWLRPGEVFFKQVFVNFLGQPVVATAYLSYSAGLLSRIADAIGRTTDAARYAAVSTQAADAWRAAFVSDGGRRIGEDKQDEYVRALAFDLLLPEQRPHALARLVELIKLSDTHLATGFLSTPMILSTLADEGRADIAYSLLLQTTAPSWLAQIDEGATSIWENWEGYKPDGHATGSHNHYAFGAVAAFLQERVAGLSPLEPGYRKIRVAPVLGGELTSAGVRVNTPFGWAACQWRRDGDRVALTVEVPAGASALIELGDVQEWVGAGTHDREALASGARDPRESDAA